MTWLDSIDEGGSTELLGTPVELREASNGREEPAAALGFRASVSQGEQRARKRDGEEEGGGRGTYPLIQEVSGGGVYLLGRSGDGSAATELLLCLEVGDEVVDYVGPSWATGERRGRGWAGFWPR
jgi:hypothetical protein